MEGEYISYTTLNSGLRICHDRSLLDELETSKRRGEVFAEGAKVSLGTLQYWF